MTITVHPFFEPAECAQLLGELDQHADLAIDRNPAIPGTFVTYGRAAYLDYCLPRADPKRDYCDAVPSVNAGLLNAFGSMYDTLRAGLSRVLDAPTQYCPARLAVPGIHIFRGRGIRSAGEAGSHFDVQYQKLPLPASIDPGTAPITFTIALRTPKCGTGLRVHNVTYDDYERAYRSGRINELSELVARRTSAYMPYEIGMLVLHHQLIVHTLSSPGPIRADDERITLQGHGLRCDGRWILYW
jgi:hypothetical protein